MRTLVVCSIVSLDGFSAGPGGDVTALPFDEGFNAYGAERLRAADTVLTGRSSYEMFHGYWPGVADDPTAPEVEREISRAHNAARKVVVSDSLVIDEDDPWSATTTVVPRAEAHATVREMLAAEGEEVLVFGSRTVASPIRMSIRSVIMGGSFPWLVSREIDRTLATPTSRLVGGASRLSAYFLIS